MITPELIEYVKSQRASGNSDEQIKAGLSAHGWSAEDVSDVLTSSTGNTPATQLSAAPAPSIAPASAMNRTLIITLSIAGVLLVSGAAFGAYRYYRSDTPTPPVAPVTQESFTPEQVVEKTKVAMASIKSFTYSTDVNVEVTGPAATAGSAVFAPIPGSPTPAKQTFHIAVSASGSSDMLQPTAPTATGKVSLTGSMTGGTRPMSNLTADTDFRVVGGSTYLKINNVSMAELQGINLATDYWIKIDPKTAQQYSTAAPMNVTQLLAQAHLTPDQILQAKALLDKTTFVEFDTTLPDETIDTQANYHYHWLINKSKLKEFIVAAAQVVKGQSLNAQELQDGVTAIEKTLQTLTLPSGEIWIRKNDFLPSKVLVDYAFNTKEFAQTTPLPSSEDVQITIHTTMSITNVNQPTTVEAPSPTKTLEEAMSSFMMGPQQPPSPKFDNQDGFGTPPSSSDATSGSFEEARAKARDARRTADIHQLVTALALYNDDTGQYPKQLSDLTLPQADANKTIYLPKIPTDPTTQQPYEYNLAVTGKTFQVCATLEQKPRLCMNENGVFPSTLTTDTDHDGLSDAEETRLGTDPNNPDTDGDGYTDGEEVKKGFSPLIKGK